MALYSLPTQHLARCALLLTACVELPQLPASHEADASSATSADRAPDIPASTLRIGSWNLRKLGLETHKDLTTIARVIDTHFDLIALNEVMWTTDGEAVQALEQQLGQGWALQITSTARPNLPYEHAEHYAVAYRLSSVAPCVEQSDLRYVADNDGSNQSDGPDLFLREPAVGCYRAAPTFGSGDFLLAVYHARWGDGTELQIASEARHIDRALDTMQVSSPRERHLFLIGDLNLSSAALQGLSKARDRTRGQGSTLNTRGDISDHLYDHLLAWGDTANRALLDDAAVIDVRAEASTPATYRAQISDHLPIVARLHLTTDDD